MEVILIVPLIPTYAPVPSRSVADAEPPDRVRAGLPMEHGSVRFIELETLTSKEPFCSTIWLTLPLSATPHDQRRSP